MIRAEKKMEKYKKSVSRRLNLPKDVKKRVMADFESAIASRKEAGKTDEEIYAELGTPAQVAAELNAQMQEFAYRKSPWRWGCFALSVLSALSFLCRGGIGLLSVAYMLAQNQSVGVIGGADGPTQIFITRTEGSTAQSLILSAILLVMSLLGWYALGHMRKK